MSKEGRLTPSEAAHRRQVLAEERRKPGFFEETIHENVRAKGRFIEVKSLLNSNGVGLEELAAEEKLSLEQLRLCLEVEQIWLKFRLNHISETRRRRLFKSKLGRLKEENPELHRWLTTPNEDDEILLVSIRNKVIPPIKIGGFHTKRRRRR